MSDTLRAMGFSGRRGPPGRETVLEKARTSPEPGKVKINS